MKKWLLLLLLPFVLAGCGDNAPQTETTAPPTEPPGLYDPENPLAESTYGAVQVFLPEDGGFQTALPLGDNLLLARQGELVLTEGARLNPVLKVQLDYDKLYPVPEGIALWQKEEGRILFLNEKLREISRLRLSEDCTGEPFLTPDGMVLYYSTGREVKALELDTGINRPVYHSTEKQIALTALLWDGGVLRCSVTSDDDGETLIISAKTGEILASGPDFESLVADGGGFFVRLTGAPVVQLVFGTNDGKTGTIWNLKSGGTLIPVPERNILLMLSCDGEAYRLDQIDLLSGRRTASVILPGVNEIWDVRVEDGGMVWFFCDAEGEPLCCWNTANSATDDETVYTAPFYTRENPDTEGLADVEARLHDLAARYGMDIRMGEAVLDAMLGDYTYTPEHMVQIYEKYTGVLEQVLSSFPEGFFAKAMEPRGGTLRLCLVRSIQGVSEKGTLNQEQGIQFWAEKDAVCAVVLNDGVEQSLYHILMHVIESRIFNKTPAFDQWNKLNPKDFSYDNDYLANLNRTDGQYLEGEGRYFIDTFSMSFAKEDRARIFEYASTPGNEELFASAAMQSKLKTLCTAIRQAFGLTKYQGELVWEQYLST